MEKESWQDENQRKLDLSLDNSTLETELHLKTGSDIQKSDDCDPVIYNQFLKNVLAYEEADKEPVVPIKSLFSENFEFPDEQMLTDAQLRKKLKDICQILSMHKVEFGFSEALPDRILYKYLVESCIPDDTVHASAGIGFTMVLDGCDGACPDCFQKEYCETGRNYDKC